ncbi:MAG: TetR/AcrR family transcriptional regulator [Anderseniella sp.]
MYGKQAIMTASREKAKPKTRLSRNDWVSTSLDVLAHEGIAAVTVDRLAKKLDITRGSFYHHFGGREDLLRAMLEYWIEKWTLQVREQVMALGLDPANMLQALSRMIRHHRASHYDAAVRAWALNHDLARQYLLKADIARLDYIKSLFEEAGFEGAELESRARLFLYYEAFDPMMSFHVEPEEEDELIRRRVALLLQK